MKAEGLNEVFFATIVFGLNGYFIANVYGNEGTNNNKKYIFPHPHTNLIYKIKIKITVVIGGKFNYEHKLH